MAISHDSNLSPAIRKAIDGVELDQGCTWSRRSGDLVTAISAKVAPNGRVLSIGSTEVSRAGAAEQLEIGIEVVRRGMEKILILDLSNVPEESRQSVADSFGRSCGNHFINVKGMPPSNDQKMTTYRDLPEEPIEFRARNVCLALRGNEPTKFELRLGKMKTELHVDPPRGEVTITHPQSGVTLIVVNGEGQAIGRSDLRGAPDNHYVSGKHIKVSFLKHERAPGGLLVLQDLGSTNGSTLAQLAV